MCVILHQSGAASPCGGRVRATRADEKDGDGVSEEATGFYDLGNDDTVLGAATGIFMIRMDVMLATIMERNNI